jgi:hypothetical protein
VRRALVVVKKDWVIDQVWLLLSIRSFANFNRRQIEKAIRGTQATVEILWTATAKAIGNDRVDSRNITDGNSSRDVCEQYSIRDPSNNSDASDDMVHHQGG